MQARERMICARSNYWDATFPTAAERAEWGVLKRRTSLAKWQAQQLLNNHPRMRRVDRAKAAMWFDAREAALNVMRE